MDVRKYLRDLLLDVEHQSDLGWFVERRGGFQDFPEMFDLGDLLSNSSRGIYKPHGYKYALSIRVLCESLYQDGQFYPLGSDGWVFAYHKDINLKDPQNSDQLWSNQSLASCRNDQIPIGIQRQTGSSQEGKSQYEIMGLGVVVGKFGDYFVLADIASSKSMSGDEITGELLLAEAESLLARENSLFETLNNPQGLPIPDEFHHRVRVFAEITRRRGQGIFRKNLLEAYKERCCISGCSDLPVLDAAHIIPFSKTVSNDTSNGLLLRTDLHTLFDEDLLGIEPFTLTVHIAESITDPNYVRLAGSAVQTPDDQSLQPSFSSLSKRWSDFQSRSLKS
jgi:putative restriction endonuclease